MEPRERSGFELSPQAGETMIYAWSSTVEGCLAEAVRGYVACFAEVDTAETPQRMLDITCEPAPEQELLVELLDQVIDIVHTQKVVPVRVTALRTPQGGVAGELGVVTASTVDVARAPEAVSRRELRVAREDGSWRCQFAVA